MIGVSLSIDHEVGRSIFAKPSRGSFFLVSVCATSFTIHLHEKSSNVALLPNDGRIHDLFLVKFPNIACTISMHFLEAH